MAKPTKRKQQQIDHDFKRVAKVIRIIIKEEDDNKRDLVGGLLIDEVERLREDVHELFENGSANGGS